jgi:hypothetical protein
MRKIYTYMVLSIVVLSSVVGSLNAQALPYTYNDYDWILNFNGPDVTQPGNVETYTFNAVLLRAGSTSLPRSAH